MKKSDVWMLGGFMGLLGAGCGAPANDSPPAGSDPRQLVKTTVVNFKAGGEREISTYYATPEQIELEEQQLVEANRRREEGGELEVIIPSSCNTSWSVWLYDIPGAGKYSGYSRCCVTSNNIAQTAQAYVNDVCGFPYAESLRAYGWGGSYGNENDCQREYSNHDLLMSLDCPDTDWISISGAE